MPRIFFSRAFAFTLLGPALLSSCTKQEEAQPLLRERSLRAMDLVPLRNDAVRLAARGDHLVATARDSRARAHTDKTPTVEVDLPIDARHAFRIASDVSNQKFAIAVRPLGTEASTGRDRDGILLYPNAYGPGTELAQVATLAGTEDYVTLDLDTRNELSYAVDLADSVAGLRLVSNTLEFLDRDGAPQLRVASPYGVDAVGKRFEAKLALDGCAADTSPAAPWGRPVTAPGARSCTVRVTWQSDALTFPIAVDPAWTTTQDMSANSVTWDLPLVVLSGGKVLAVPGGTAAQIFDPVTNTWAATGAPPMYFGYRTRMISVGGNQAWATGGIEFGQMQKTARYDLAAGSWTSTADTPNGAGSTDGKALAYIGNSTVLLFDSSGTVHAYDVANDNYTARTSFGGYLGYNTGAWLFGGDVYIQGGASPFIRTYNVANDAWTSSSDVQPFMPDNNTGQIERLTNGKFLTWGKGNYAFLWDPVTDSSTAVPFPAGVPDVGYLCFRSSQVTFGGGKMHLIGAGRLTYNEDTNTITDNGDASVNVHSVIVKLQDGRILAAGQSNIHGQSNKVDFYSPSSQADCDGSFANPLTPVYNASTNSCVACGSNNGGAALPCPNAALPVCLMGGVPNSGACVECAYMRTAACSSATKPACDLATNTCSGANGDYLTSATIPCPTGSLPYQNPDGSCGKCTKDADCVGANHGGPVCNVTRGSCQARCVLDADCKAGTYCTPSNFCTPKRLDDEPCTRKEECANGYCNSGKCATFPPADAGAPADAGKPTTDGGNASSSSGGLDSGAPTTDAATSSSSTSSGNGAGNSSNTDSGGCGCKASARSDKISSRAVGAMVVVALAFLRRRKGPRYVARPAAGDETPMALRAKSDSLASSAEP